MANPSKNKGDRYERDAVKYLVENWPHLCRDGAMRMLGAGRKDDVGDLDVFTARDVAIQVRAYAKTQIGAAIRSSAADSVVQAANGQMPHALGMVPWPGARVGSVRWLACVHPGAWPTLLPVEPIEFALVGRALQWVRDDDGPYGYEARPRVTRVALLAAGTSADSSPVLIAPMEAWMEAYQDSHMPHPRLDAAEVALRLVGV